MTDEPTSGNRWEPPSAGAPDDGATPAEVAPVAAAAEHPQPWAAQETAPSATGPVGWRRRLTAVRTKLTAAAAVLFLGGGAAGYAVGHTAADSGGGSTPPSQTTFDPDGDGHNPGFGGHHDGPGTQPGQGTDPGAGES